MRFFFDSNLPARLAKAIDILMDRPHQAVHLSNKFRPDTPDADWVRALASERDWVIICGDPKIMRRPHERKALQKARLITFFLKPGWTNLRLWPLAAKLVQWWPDIMETARRVTPGAAFLVPVNYTGKFEQVRQV